MATTSPCILLLAKDDQKAADFSHYLQSSRMKVNLIQMASTEETLQYLVTATLDFTPFPQLVVLSQPLPADLGGLKAIKASYPHLPVVVFSYPLDAATLADAYQLGANTVMMLRRQEVEAFLHYWFDIAVLPSPPLFYHGL